MQALIISSIGILVFSTSAIAEDGGRIAYVAVTDGFWQLWVMDPDGSNRRQVSRTPYDKMRCSWFPDGRQVLVSALDGRLLKIDIDSGQEEQIPNPLPGTIDGVVSPDGSKIAFSLSPTDSREDNEIWMMDPDGSNLVKLTDMEWIQHEPQWSPDGRWIYFLSGKGGQDHDIWRVSPASGARQQLTSGVRYHFELAFSPSGMLAFSNNRTGNYEVYVQEEGGAPRQVTTNAARDGHPTWSPKGDELIFDSMRSGQMNLWRISANGGEAVQLTDHPMGARGPVWWHPSPGSQ